MIFRINFYFFLVLFINIILIEVTEMSYPGIHPKFVILTDSRGIG